MSEALEVVFRASEDARARVLVWGRAYPGGQSVFDHNWLNTEIAVRRRDGPSWRYHAFLRAGDFVRFARELAELCAGDRAVARFDPRDPWLAADYWISEDRPELCCRVRLRDGGSERGALLAGAVPAEGGRELLQQVRAVAERYPVRKR